MARLQAQLREDGERFARARAGLNNQILAALDALTEHKSVLQEGLARTAAALRIRLDSARATPLPLAPAPGAAAAAALLPAATRALPSAGAASV